jgi:methionine synthase I (cobalamin-dependent)
MDGALGTELLRLVSGARAEETTAADKTGPFMLETLNVTAPDLVRGVHRRYLEAGAESLLTNTFLAPHQADERRQAQEVRAGLELARQVAGRHVFVVGSIGTVMNDSSEALAAALRAIRLLDGADALLLETQSSCRLAEALLEEMPARGPTIPLLVSFTFVRQGILDRSKPPPTMPILEEDQAEALARWAEAHRPRVAALGVNCGRELGPEQILGILRRYRRHTDLPLLVRPNAGSPRRLDDRWVYPHTPEIMARNVPAFIEAGATLIGGCCGTSPAHIEAFARTLTELGMRNAER